MDLTGNDKKRGRALPRVRRMANRDETSGQPALETVDAVARSAHLWIRWLDKLDKRPADERQALLGGLVSGLCDLMELDPGVRELAAYAAALLEQGDAEPLKRAREMVAHPDGPRLRAVYQRGRYEAHAIVLMLRNDRDPPALIPTGEAG
jgi:hypothetical protein